MRQFSRVARWVALGAALLVLNAALTFHNVWPTLAVRFGEPWPELSAEFALAVLVLAAWGAWRGPVPRWVPGALAGAWLVLGVARYAEVTAPALYGRPVNLYWDARHVGNVLRMLAEAAGPALTAAAAFGAAAALLVSFLGLRFAWSRVASAAAHRHGRRVLGVAAAGLVACWAASLASVPLVPDILRFAAPVSATYADQARLVAHAFARARSPADGGHYVEVSGAPGNPLAALAGDDVLLVFVESYGNVTYTRPEFAARLAASRRGLADAVAQTGRRVMSATVTAPTFGGNSWLSHLTLLTGIEVGDPDAYARTMQGARRTLVTDFALGGYRTVALMPGLRQAWPEGAFYRFDAILGADALDYRGPEFGWWRIPDQYALARLEQVERGAQPRFVFFPTISSHAPFRPTPPYQPDWARLTSATPFGAEAQAALGVAPEWHDLGPAYADTIAYAHEWLAGYLERHAASDVTLVILGDHQPPAAVSGQGADWTVPVHVVTRRDAVLDPLRQHGFVAGLQPAAGPIGRMHELQPLLRAAFAAAPSGTAVDATRVDVAGAAGEPAVGEARLQRVRVEPLVQQPMALAGG